MPIVPGDLRGQDFEVTEIGIIFWLWKNKLALKKCCSQHTRRMRIAKTKAKKTLLYLCIFEPKQVLVSHLR
jgi:hypothetical protein